MPTNYLTGQTIDSKEAVLERFMAQYPKLMEFGPDVSISETFSTLDSETEEETYYNPPLLEIDVKHPFIFDNRLVPESFENLEVKNFAAGEIPERFNPDEDGLPLWEVYSPQNYIDFVEENEELIRTELRAPHITKAEMLEALTGNWHAYVQSTASYKEGYKNQFGEIFNTELDYKSITEKQPKMKEIVVESPIIKELNKLFDEVNENYSDVEQFANAAKKFTSLVLALRNRNVTFAHAFSLLHPSEIEQLRESRTEAVKAGNYDEAAEVRAREISLAAEVDFAFVQVRKYFILADDNIIAYSLPENPSAGTFLSALGQDLDIDKIESLLAKSKIDLPLKTSQKAENFILAVGAAGFESAVAVCKLNPDKFDLAAVKTLGELKKFQTLFEKKKVFVVSGLETESVAAFTEVMVHELLKLRGRDRLFFFAATPKENNEATEAAKKLEKLFISGKIISADELLKRNPILKNYGAPHFCEVITWWLADEISSS